MPSWFSQEMSGSVTDMRIVRVFAAGWDSSGPSFIQLSNADILGHPQRWVALPNERDWREAQETSRLRKTPAPSAARQRTADIANGYYRNYPRKHDKPRSADPQDILWTVQSLCRVPGMKSLDDCNFLYVLYKKNLEVFGEKAERDLYVLELRHALTARYTIPQPTDEQTFREGTLKLSLFAILKEAAYSSRTDYGCTWFSPVVGIAVVLSPHDVTNNSGWGMDSIIDVSLDLEAARWTIAVDGSMVQQGVHIDAIAFEMARERIINTFESFLWTDLHHLMLTSFTTFVLDLKSAERLEVFVSPKPPTLCTILRRRSRLALFHFIGRLSSVGWRVTVQPLGFWWRRATLRCGRAFKSLTLDDFVKLYLPERTSLSLDEDSASIVAPGRKVLLQTFDETTQIDECVAWNILLLDLATGQEALLTRFHSALSDEDNVPGVKQGLRDFDDFYDIELFDLPYAARYQESFHAITHALALDRQVQDPT